MIAKFVFFAGLALLSALPAASLEWAAAPYTVPLPIPPLLEDRDLSTGEMDLQLTADKGSVRFFQGIDTPTLGYNGDFLGPTIRVKRGQRVQMTVINALDEVTTVHWHGLHVPGEMDGGPHQKIPAGETWNPWFDINQPAATLWYHPHALGITGKQVYGGLAGFFIIDDDHEATLPLPRDYGIDDIPVVIQDRRFDEEGSLLYIQGMPDVMHGVVGNVPLVNGVPYPVLTLQAGLNRLRILNGSNAGIYRISLEGKTLAMIASDGGLLPETVYGEKFILSPGERGEFLVDLTEARRGEEFALVMEEYGGRSHKAMRIRVSRDAPPSDSPVKRIPDVLAPVWDYDTADSSTTRRFSLNSRMGRHTINGLTMDMNRIDAEVTLGATEIWEITNATMMNIPHSFHMHDVQFLVLDRDGEAPPLQESGPKDTVPIWPGQTIRIVTRFEDYEGLYMFHCHLLEHEDAGMMSQFRVTAKGSRQ